MRIRIRNPAIKDCERNIFTAPQHCFFLFLGVIFVLLDPDPKSMWIYAHPDSQQCTTKSTIIFSSYIFQCLTAEIQKTHFLLSNLTNFLWTKYGLTVPGGVIEEIVTAAAVVYKNHHRDGQAPVSRVKLWRIKKDSQFIVWIIINPTCTSKNIEVTFSGSGSGFQDANEKNFTKSFCFNVFFAYFLL